VRSRGWTGETHPWIDPSWLESRPGSGFDQLRVAGQAVLDGTLDLDTASSYAPGSATNPKVVAMTSRLGEFSQSKDTGLPGGREWYATYNAGDVTLRVRRA
jgi:hypothetical protein